MLPLVSKCFGNKNQRHETAKCTKTITILNRVQSVGLAVRVT